MLSLCNFYNESFLGLARANRISWLTTNMARSGYISQATRATSKKESHLVSSLSTQYHSRTCLHSAYSRMAPIDVECRAKAERVLTQNREEKAKPKGSAQPAHAADRFAREIIAILTLIAARLRRLMGNSFGVREAWSTFPFRYDAANLAS